MITRVKRLTKIIILFLQVLLVGIFNVCMLLWQRYLKQKHVGKMEISRNV